MTSTSLRIQFISDRESIAALATTAAGDSVVTEPHEVSGSDQRFGIAEAAAIIAVVHSAAQVAKLLAQTFKILRAPKSITIKTPTGSVTIQGNVTSSADDILKAITERKVL